MVPMLTGKTCTPVTSALPPGAEEAMWVWWGSRQAGPKVHDYQLRHDDDLSSGLSARVSRGEHTAFLWKRQDSAI